VGRIKQQLQRQAAKSLMDKELLDAQLVCPLCERFIPDSQKDAHHLVPKSKGGKNTQFLHRICHRQIHALFTETELARKYSSIVALAAQPELAIFINWVKTKPNDFFQRTSKSRRLKN
jgi:5-methylcytosine-specific restriction endonuclease McrA